MAHNSTLIFALVVLTSCGGGEFSTADLATGGNPGTQQTVVEATGGDSNARPGVTVYSDTGGEKATGGKSSTGGGAVTGGSVGTGGIPAVVPVTGGATFAATGGAVLTGGQRSTGGSSYAATGGSSPVSTCTTGTLNCPCFSSETCAAAGLTCNSDKVCVGPAGSGGSASIGGGSSTGGASLPPLPPTVVYLGYQCTAGAKQKPDRKCDTGLSCENVTGGVDSGPAALGTLGICCDSSGRCS
jgi:hypothetical protein